MGYRILIAKPGLDGHDRGAKVVAMALRDAGFEVIYTGIRQRPIDIATAAVQEDVDAVGLSVLSGAHVSLTRKITEALQLENAGDIPVIVGGTIPSGDFDALRAAGASAIFPTGTTVAGLTAGVRALLDARTESPPSPSPSAEPRGAPEAAHSSFLQS
jgi:methylmalonyl-CoA mutase C-terminal domain/subunit